MSIVFINNKPVFQINLTDSGVRTSETASTLIGQTNFNFITNPPNSGGSAPIISNESEYSKNEGVATAITELTSDDPTATWSIVGGNDNALFIIANDNELYFLQPPNYEEPLDDDEDNIYYVSVRATNAFGYSDKSISVTVNNLNDGEWLFEVTTAGTTPLAGKIALLTGGDVLVSPLGADQLKLSFTSIGGSAFNGGFVQGKILKFTNLRTDEFIHLVVDLEETPGGDIILFTFNVTITSNFFGGQASLAFETGDKIRVESIGNQITTVSYAASAGFWLLGLDSGLSEVTSSYASGNNDVQSVVKTRYAINDNNIYVYSTNNAPNYTHKLIFSGVAGSYDTSTFVFNTLSNLQNADSPSLNITSQGAAATHQTVVLGHGGGFPIYVSSIDNEGGIIEVTFDEYGEPYAQAASGGMELVGGATFRRSTPGVSGRTFSNPASGTLISQVDGTEATTEVTQFSLTSNASHEPLADGAMTLDGVGSINYDADTATVNALLAGVIGGTTTGSGTVADPFIHTAPGAGPKTDLLISGSNFKYAGSIGFSVT